MYRFASQGPGWLSLDTTDITSPRLSPEKKKGSVVASQRRWNHRGGMAEAELQTFTSIMDALVRISVSVTLILLRYFFQPRVRILNGILLLSFVLHLHIWSHNIATFPLDLIWMHRVRMWWRNVRHFFVFFLFFFLGIYWIKERFWQSCSTVGRHMKARPQIACTRNPNVVADNAVDVWWS